MNNSVATPSSLEFIPSQSQLAQHAPLAQALHQWSPQPIQPLQSPPQMSLSSRKLRQMEDQKLNEQGSQPLLATPPGALINATEKRGNEFDQKRDVSPLPKELENQQKVAFEKEMAAPKPMFDSGALASDALDTSKQALAKASSQASDSLAPRFAANQGQNLVGQPKQVFYPTNTQPPVISDGAPNIPLPSSAPPKVSQPLASHLTVQQQAASLGRQWPASNNSGQNPNLQHHWSTEATSTGLQPAPSVLTDHHILAAKPQARQVVYLQPAYNPHQGSQVVYFIQQPFFSQQAYSVMVPPAQMHQTSFAPNQSFESQTPMYQQQHFSKPFQFKSSHSQSGYVFSRSDRLRRLADELTQGSSSINEVGQRFMNGSDRFRQATGGVFVESYGQQYNEKDNTSASETSRSAQGDSHSAKQASNQPSQQKQRWKSQFEQHEHDAEPLEEDVDEHNSTVSELLSILSGSGNSHQAHREQNHFESIHLDEPRANDNGLVVGKTPSRENPASQKAALQKTQLQDDYDDEAAYINFMGSKAKPVSKEPQSDSEEIARQYKSHQKVQMKPNVQLSAAEQLLGQPQLKEKENKKQANNQRDYLREDRDQQMVFYDKSSYMHAPKATQVPIF